MPSAMRYHHSWPSESRVAFESIIAAHGGWDAWAAIEVVELELTAFDGALLRLKGYQRSFQRPSRVVVHVKSRRVEFRYDARSDWFEDGAVWLPAKDLRVADGRTLFRGGARLAQQVRSKPVKEEAQHRRVLSSKMSMQRAASPSRPAAMRHL